MAASNALLGFGASLLKGNADGPPETFTALGVEVTSITPPSYSRTAIDVTHMSSPDTFREHIAGMMDAGEFSIEFNYIPAASDVVEAALVAGKQNWQILFSNDIAFTMSAFVTAYSTGTPLDDRMSGTATFKISGKPTLSDES